MKNEHFPFLANDLAQNYAIFAEDIRRVHGGSVAYAFAIDEQYFLKLYDADLAMTSRCTEHLQEQLRTLLLLRENGSLRDRICCPVPCLDGRLFYSHGKYTGVLFRWIAGETIGYHRDYTEAETDRLAEIVRQLHAVDPTPFEKFCPREHFSPDFLFPLTELLARRGNGLCGDFRRLTEEYADKITEKAARVLVLAELVKAKKLPYVLCHTDIHGGNLIKNAAGDLFLLDWENVILAPKEADLFTFCERTDFAKFSEDTDKTALQYYLLRRDLEDIWEFFDGILHGEYDPAEQAEVLGHLKRICGHLCACEQ